MRFFHNPEEYRSHPATLDEKTSSAEKHFRKVPTYATFDRLNFQPLYLTSNTDALAEVVSAFPYKIG